MKGREVSDQAAEMVRELRRRGLSLGRIAQRAKISKTSVYRLTRGISWEQHMVQPELAQVGRILEGERPEQAMRPIAVPEPQGPRATKACLIAQEGEESELDEAEAYVRGIPLASKLYEQIDFEHLLDAMRSKDPLGEYRELRKKALSSAVVMLRLCRKHHPSAQPI